jgi:exopolysaccharide production protein ExoZ
MAESIARADAGGLVRELEYPVIDGIRCYAALVVFMVHFFGSATLAMMGIAEKNLTMTSSDPVIVVLAYLSDGNHGVDAFFIVSGFLMARVVRARKHAFSYWKFMSSRVRRIYPAFLATLILATLLRCLAFDWPFRPVDFAMNLVFANAVPGASIVPYNAVSWSLGYEFAFYLIIPVLWLAGRVGDARIAGAVLLFAAIALVPDSIVRADGLFVGAFIGCFPDDVLRRAAMRIPLLLVVPAYMALIPVKGLALVTYKEFYFAFLVLAGLLFVRLVFGGGRLAGWLRSRPVRAMGTISYSFYLLHTLALAIALRWVVQPLGPQFPLWAGIPLYFVVSMLLAVLGAWVSFRLFEQFYFRRRAHAGSSLPGETDRDLKCPRLAA